MMLGQLFPETGEIASLFDTVIRSNFSLFKDLNMEKQNYRT